jgi:hypothetical protein
MHTRSPALGIAVQNLTRMLLTPYRNLQAISAPLHRFITDSTTWVSKVGTKGACTLQANILNNSAHDSIALIAMHAHLCYSLSRVVEYTKKVLRYFLAKGSCFQATRVTPESFRWLRRCPMYCHFQLDMAHLTWIQSFSSMLEIAVHDLSASFLFTGSFIGKTCATLTDRNDQGSSCATLTLVEMIGRCRYTYVCSSTLEIAVQEFGPPSHCGTAVPGVWVPIC